MNRFATFVGRRGHRSCNLGLDDDEESQLSRPSTSPSNSIANSQIDFDVDSNLNSRFTHQSSPTEFQEGNTQLQCDYNSDGSREQARYAFNYSTQDDDEESQISTHCGTTNISNRHRRARNDDEDASSRGSKPSIESATRLPVSTIHIPALVTSILVSISAPDILFYGLLYAGFDLKRQQANNEKRRVDWFKSFYGVEPSTVSPIFDDLRNEYPDINFKVALMTMQWLFLYPTYPVLSGQWKWCEEFIGAKVIDYGNKFAFIGRRKIVFVLKHKVQIGRTVDCTTFMVFEMRLDPSSKWFDYKTHSCGLKYEFCLAIYEDRVVWMNGPVAPSIHDITVFRGGDADEDVEDRDQDALYFQLEEGEMCIADSGYSGEPSKCLLAKDEHPQELKELAARAKNRQETFHWRLKAFNILGGRFRHGKNTKHRMELHKIVVEAVVGIIQYDFENGHPPFKV
mmetsp:Transcript_4342/g.9641  ORF Transcript_4342/g.9641 Transcript_4342/m.9641 type:complete len:455 (+) Transcript_4342:92-1456(+)